MPAAPYSARCLGWRHLADRDEPSVRGPDPDLSAGYRGSLPPHDAAAGPLIGLLPQATLAAVVIYYSVG
jgi:hypothetical protein